jgi:transglutaminase/protease-like cytokinesis protein 3
MKNRTSFLIPMRLSSWILFIILLSKTAIANEENARYAEVDRHALAAPVEVTKSIKKLSAYLTKPFTTDEEKARAIFRWIADNITYDVEGFFSGRESASASGDVLKSRSSVCAGYSSLFEELGKAAGLNVATIDGYAKGFDYQPGDRIPAESNHSWNAIKIRDEWKLIDCTWGAGKVDDEHVYHKEFEPYYFLTKPGEFVYRHFPADKRWQLLPRPISRQEFLNLPFAGPQFFEYGFVMDSLQGAVLDWEPGHTLQFSATADVLCAADLLQKGKKWEAATLVQKDGTSFRIHILPPAAGEYILRIYARRGKGEGELPLAVCYKVIA